jgi:hypothetical protein
MDTRRVNRPRRNAEHLEPIELTLRIAARDS